MPLALISSLRSVISAPSQASKGVRSCRRLEAGSTLISTAPPSIAGAWYPLSFTSKPFSGSSTPLGSSSLTSSPFSFFRVSVRGLKLRSPAIAIAVTISGEATKEWVLGFPSFRLAKLRLKEVIMEFFSSLSAPCLAHCPIQGPHALASTTPPISSKVLTRPSRSMV